MSMKLPALRVVALLMMSLAADAANAQQPKVARIGFVSMHSPAMAAHVGRFRDGLRAFGRSDGSIELEVHFTDGSRDKTREIIGGLVQKGVDVLVVWTTPTAQIAREVTQGVPLVMIASDPVAAKLVPSLAHPGGNLTGVSMSGPDLAGKRLELLREIMPGIRAIAFSRFFHKCRGGRVHSGNRSLRREDRDQGGNEADRRPRRRQRSAILRA
jgi:putative ABC transport system substrate-binding protein